MMNKKTIIIFSIAVFLLVFTLVNAADTVELRNPANHIITNSSTVDFIVNATFDSNSSITNITIWAGNDSSWAVIGVNTSAISNQTQNTIQVTGLGDGIYQWTAVMAINDSLLNVLNGSNYSLIIDSVIPNASVAFASTNLTNSYFVNASQNDTTSNVSSVAFGYENPSTSLVWVAASNGATGYWNSSIDISSLSEGWYNLSVMSNDTVGNSNATYNASQFYVDNTQPNVALTTPTQTNITGSVHLNATVSDDSSSIGTVRIGFFPNDGGAITWLQAVGIGQGVWTNLSYDTSALADGLYNITVSANDTAGNENITYDALENVIIDNNAPGVLNISLINPANHSSFNISVPINFTVNDTGSGVKNVSVGYSNASSGITWVSTSSLGSNLYNVTLAGSLFELDGNYNLSVRIFDNYNNSIEIQNYSGIIKDTSVPQTNATLNAVNDTDRDGNIELSWSLDPSEAGVYYRIYRHTGNITEINDSVSLVYTTTAVDATSFEDNSTTGTNATTYYYTLVTIDNASNVNLTALSNVVSSTANDTISPDRVTNLTNSTSGTTTVTISLGWRAVDKDMDGNADEAVTYRIYRATSAPSTVLTNFSDSAYTLWKSTSSNSTTDTQGEEGSYTYHYLVTAIDDNSNVNTTANIGINYVNVSYTVTASSSSSSSSSSSGGSSGGGGLIVDDSDSVSYSKAWSNIGEDKNTMVISVDGIPFNEVSFWLFNSGKDAKVTVTAKNDRPSGTKAIGDDIYKFITIEKTNIPDDDVTRAEIRFKVEKEWLTSNGYDSNDVLLLRYNEDLEVWQSFSPALRNVADPDYFFYVVEKLPGLSEFAIIARERSSDDSDTVDDTSNQVDEEPEAPTEENNEQQNEQDTSSGSGSFPWVPVIIVLILVVVGAVVFIERDKISDVVNNMQKKKKK